MKFLKKHIRLIILIIILIIIASGISVYATTTYFATNIIYTRNNVNMNISDALDYLYSNQKETSDEIKNITTSGSQTLDKYYKNLNVDIPNNSTYISGNFTSISGNNTISIGFTPKELLFIRKDSPLFLDYRSDYSTSYYLYRAGTKNLFKVKIGTGSYIWSVGSDDQFNSVENSPALKTYLKSVGSNSIIYTETAGGEYYWIAYE